MQFYDVRVVQVFVDFYFIVQYFFLVWIETVLLNYFNRSLSSCAFVYSESNLSKWAWPNYFADAVNFSNRLRSVFSNKVIRLDQDVFYSPD